MVFPHSCGSEPASATGLAAKPLQQPTDTAIANWDKL